jgi:hypothetical protein
VLHELSKPLLAFAQFLLGLLALRNVIDRQDDPAVDAPWAMHTSGVEQHAAAAETLEVPLDQEVLDGVALGENLFEQRAQFGNDPLTIAQLVDELADGIGRRDGERAIEGTVGALDARVGIEHDQRLSHGPDDVLRILPRGGSRELAALQVVEETVQLGIPTSHLFVDRDELLVRGLEFFLGGFQLLVDALQLLVGGLDFFVGGPKLLVCRLVLFLERAHVVARFRELCFECGNAARLRGPRRAIR